MASYTSILESKGFKYSETKMLWIKPIGFGQSMTCEKIFMSLFEIRKNGKVLFSNFIDSQKEFEKTLNKYI